MFEHERHQSTVPNLFIVLNNTHYVIIQLHSWVSNPRNIGRLAVDSCVLDEPEQAPIHAYTVYTSCTQAWSDHTCKLNIELNCCK